MSKYHFCIWCGKDFETVARSDEHIIPEAIFGGIKTDDVCNVCNRWLGSKVDWAFLNDPTIEAALEAGIQVDQLLARYNGRMIGRDGTQIETVVRKGVSAVVPQLNGVEGSLIGDRLGRFEPEQLAGMKQIARRRVQRLHPKMSEEEINSCLEDLFRRAMAGPEEGDVYAPEIGEVVSRSVVEGHPTVCAKSVEAADAARAAGKAIYEAMRILAPTRTQQAIREALNTLRRFVKDEIPGDQLIGYTRLALPAQRSHSICVFGEGDKMGCRVSLFGRIEWSLSLNCFSRSGRPASIPRFAETINCEF